METKLPLEIELLYFAVLRERMHKAGEKVLLPLAVRTVGDLKLWLEAERPPLSGALEVVRFAVGDEFAELERELCPGDVVALLPPVSGG